jgi:hypothetical protein
MQYICEHSKILNTLISTYSNLTFQYPEFSNKEIKTIHNSFILDFTFDVQGKKISINEQALSPVQQFVLLYLQTIELIQLFIDIYNTFERKDTEQPLLPLKNGI